MVHITLLSLGHKMSREFTDVVDLTNVNGLRPERNATVNAGFLETCYNMRADADGLKGIETPTLVFSGDNNGQQYYLNGARVLEFEYVSAPTLKYITKPAGVWTRGSDLLTSGQGLSVLDNSTLVTMLLDGLRVDHAEINDVWFITTGSAMLTNCGLYDDWAVALASTSPVPTAICIKDGRLIMGGFTAPANFFSTDSLWLKAFAAWKTANGEEATVTEDDVFDASYIFYGTPRGGASDIPFLLEMVLLTGYKSDIFEAMVVDAFRSGDMGFLKLPRVSTIRNVFNSNDSIVVCSDKCVSVIASNFIDIQTVNIGSLSACSYQGVTHFISPVGDIWRLDSDGALRLGYKEYISTQASTLTRMFYNKKNNDIYIVQPYGEAKYDGWLLTDKGLSQLRHVPTSFIDGIADLRGSIGDENALGAVIKVKPHFKSLNRRARKLIKVVEVEQQGCTVLSSIVSWRMNSADSFTDTNSNVMNYEDISYPMVQAVEFTPTITGTPNANETLVSLDRIRIRWNALDRRGIRGLTEQPNVQ